MTSNHSNINVENTFNKLKIHTRIQLLNAKKIGIKNSKKNQALLVILNVVSYTVSLHIYLVDSKIQIQVVCMTVVVLCMSTTILFLNNLK